MEDRATKFRKFIEQLPRLCSPTICGTLSQPTTRAERSSSKSDKFEWSLEQKAILSPANITTATCSDLGEMDHSFLQQESEQFFSQKTIAPSPMTTPSTRTYSRSQPAPNRWAQNDHMMFDERDEDEDEDETEDEEEDENEDGEEDDDADGESSGDVDEEDNGDHDNDQRGACESDRSSSSDTDIDMDVLQDDENDDEANDACGNRQQRHNRIADNSDSDNDTDHYEMTDDNFYQERDEWQQVSQQQTQRQPPRIQQHGHSQPWQANEDGVEDEDDEYNNSEDEDASMRSHHQDMDSLFLSPPLRSSQTQQRVDIFSPETFSRVMDDENTLQSTPKTIGSQIFRTRTRRGSGMSD